MGEQMREQLRKWKKKKRKKKRETPAPNERMSRRDIEELMGVRRARYHRKGGAIQQK
jgi:hypothetical protein